ncbi:MAG: acylphosphatase [Erysipelotrichales bacterium]|nr:acylphosphatase [Erysipelotrichales bacterium]
MKKRYYIVACGRVQGVGFRYTMQCNALSLDLTGWVRNMDNGNVEMEVEGDDENITKFCRMMRENKYYIRVDDYSIKEIPLQNDTTFRITH